ncbi:DCC1-like thiol-disulfide oxidoreductase family protein [Thermaurantiacus sp.]
MTQALVPVATTARPDTQPEAGREAPWLVYDRDCPFCAAYVKLLRLRGTVGQIHLIDARGGGPEVERIRRVGLDLDEGMVLQLDGRLHHGEAAIHALALLTTPSGVFNRLMRWVFRSEARSRLLYPVLRSSRNAALRILGRSRING